MILRLAPFFVFVVCYDLFIVYSRNRSVIAIAVTLMLVLIGCLSVP